MKKISIATALVASAIVFANAQELRANLKAEVRPSVTIGQGNGMGNDTGRVEANGVVTGDVAIDAEVRLLLKEEQDKIQAIRVEYQAKLKKLIGDKKVRFVASSSSTVQVNGGMMGEDNGNGMKRGVMDANGRTDMEVKGNAFGLRIKMFFREMFGGSN